MKKITTFILTLVLLFTFSLTAFAHPAVAEHHPFEGRVPEAGEVDETLVAGDVSERRLRQLGSRQPAAPQLDPPQR